MGGNAFDQTHNLRVPRIPQHIYIEVRNYILEALLTYYTDAKTPIEAPDKTDHGDIDVLVHGAMQAELDPHRTDKQLIAKWLSGIFSAHAIIVGKGEQPIHLAIPYPPQYRNKNDPIECFIQVDLHICGDVSTFRWEYFHAAHGDLWSILGSVIKPWGLTVNGKGLSVRVPEIEAVSPKSSLVFLTDDPTEILIFLGMDHNKWWKKFSSNSELYEYAATCRMFHAGEAIPESGEHTEEDIAQELNPKDRKRFKSRPLFREWFTLFLPTLRLQGRYCKPLSITREQIRTEALARFQVNDKYHKALGDWLLKKNQLDLLHFIKENIPDSQEGQERAAIIREMKEIFVNGGEFGGVVPEAAERDNGGLYDLEKVGAFEKKNWEVLRDTGLARELERSRKLLLERNLALTAEKEATEK